MKILNTFIGNYPRVKYEKKQLQNSFALEKDTVSFTGKVSKENLSSSNYFSGITLELISDRKVREIVSRVIETEGQQIPLSVPDFLKVIEYFGYRRNRNRDDGDHRVYERDKNNLPDGNFKTSLVAGSENKQIDHGLMAELRCGLRNVNRFNGELYLNAIKTELEAKADVIAVQSSNFIPKNDKNLYRMALRKAIDAEKTKQNEEQEKIANSERKKTEINANQARFEEIEKINIINTCNEIQSSLVELYEEKLLQVHQQIGILQQNAIKFPNFRGKINEKLNICRQLETQIEQQMMQCNQDFENAKKKVNDESQLIDYHTLHTEFNEILECYESVLSDFEDKYEKCANAINEIVSAIEEYEIGKFTLVSDVIAKYGNLIKDLKSVTLKWAKRQAEIKKDKLDEPSYNDEILCNSAKELYWLYQKAIDSLQQYVSRLEVDYSKMQEELTEKSKTADIYNAKEYADILENQIQELRNYYVVKIENAENNLDAQERDYRDASNQARNNRADRMRKKFEHVASEDVRQIPQIDIPQEDVEVPSEITNVAIEDVPAIIKVPMGEKTQIIIPEKVIFSDKTQEIVGKLASKMLPIKVGRAQVDITRLVISTLELEENPNRLDNADIGNFKTVLNELTKAMSNSSQYKNIIRSLIFALQSNSNTHDIATLVQMAHDGVLDMKKVETTYIELVSPINNNEKMKLQNLIFKYCPNLSKQEKTRVIDLISKQSKYMNFLLEENTDKETVKQILQLFWGDFGNPEYAEISFEEYEKELRNKFIEENTFVEDDDFE